MVVTLVLFSNAPLPLSQLLPLVSLHFPPSWIMIIAFLKAYLRVVVFFYFTYLFYLLLAVLRLHCCKGFSPVVTSWGHSLAVGTSFSLWRLLLLQSPGSRACGLQSLQHLGSGSVVVA